MVTSRLRRGRDRRISHVKLDRPRGQRIGKQPALFEMPRREVIQHLPIVEVILAGLDVVPQRLVGVLCIEFRLDAGPIGRDGGTRGGMGDQSNSCSQ